MDHKVSKDMISSGMIPSGEKTQADLGRTQYGSAPSPSSLADAYKSIYEHHQKDKDGNTIPHEDEEVNEGKIPAGLQAYLDKKKGKKEDKKEVKEDFDLFDVLSDKLIEEGYSKEESYKIMSNLTKEQLEEINEALVSGLAMGAGLLKGMLGAGKVAAAVGKGALSAGKAVASKSMTAAKSAASGLKSVAKTGMTKATKALGKVSNVAKDKASEVGRSVGDDIKNEVKRKILQGSDGGSNKITKTGTMSAGSYQAASADLFDIVKGQLLDEGLSEEEIKDIMLTLTPDEILNEISAETALAASKARDVQAGKLKGPENTEKRAELRAKASQNYDRSVEKRKAGFVKNTASPQGPSRIPTSGM